LAFALIKKLLENIPEAAPYGEWYKIGNATTGQEKVIREFARRQGFKNLRGFNKWMEKKGWDYYDVIKVSCRD
jgi:hypothetical protein